MFLNTFILNKTIAEYKSGVLSCVVVAFTSDLRYLKRTVQHFCTEFEHTTLGSASCVLSL